MFVKKNMRKAHFSSLEAGKPMAKSSSKVSDLRRKPSQARSQARVARILAVAQTLFVKRGYGDTTTNAIALEAKVSIGTLYQFFPDKAAILQALSLQHAVQLRQHVTAVLDTAEVVALPLPEYLDRLIGAIYQFFIENPGYQAIFMEVQGTMPELDEIDRALDIELMQDLSMAFSKRNVALTLEDCDAIGFVLVKSVGNILWLSLAQEEKFRQRLVVEAKRLALSYLQSYFPIDNNVT
jgi:AcrR family transcriptional regulator